MYLFVTGRSAHSAAMPVLFLLTGPKMGFSPAGATRCPDKRESWHGGADRANFHVYRGKNVGIQPPKLSKFRILARNLYLRFALFLRNSQRLYASIGIAFKFLVWSLSRDKHPSYKHFPAVGALSHKFSVAPSGETTTRIKKSCKNGTDLLYHHAKYGGDRGSRAGCRRKSVMFLFFCLFFYVTLSNYEVCDNGNAMKQCNF